SKGALSSGFKRRTPREAFKMIHQLYKEFRDDERNINKASLTSLDLLSFFKQLTAATRKEQSADAVETALRLIQYHVHLNHQWPHNISDLLTLTDLDSKTHTAECSGILQPSDCKNSCWSNRYRDINSNCNNRRTAHLGTTNTPFVRWLPAQYEDGFSLPKGWIEGKLYSEFPLPLVIIIAAPDRSKRT
ncbi:hypothetical protein scyTo_0021559, partial [Scyliorhinus torazame]|nr:hypothetical protein [Scyliorhinus torazame]